MESRPHSVADHVPPPHRGRPARSRSPHYSRERAVDPSPFRGFTRRFTGAPSVILEAVPRETAVVERVESSDGTPIAYWRSGEGPPLVLLHGAMSAHWSFDLLVPALVDRFTVFAVDRRGRGESGDRPDYAIEREFEDAAAVVDSIPAPATLFGHSYGATVALGAALLAETLDKLILYEGSPGVTAASSEDLERAEELVAKGRREEALVHVLRAFGFTSEELEQLQAAPTWPKRVAAAHTVVREARAEEACLFDPELLGVLTTPTLLLLGEESPAWAGEGTEQIRAALPNARVAVLPGQAHMAHLTAPELLADEIARFLGDSTAPAGRR
jgi:pimeloyl-ACP methyl ester carboxylesterase